MRLCGELGGGRLDDWLDGEGAHREPTAKNAHVVSSFHFLRDIILKCILSDNLYKADRRHLLLYEVVPVLLYKIPDKQVASEAVADGADDQRQLLCLDDVPLQASL